VTRRLLFGYLAITLMVLGVLAVPLGISYKDRLLEKKTNDLVKDAFVQASRVQAAVVAGRIDAELTQTIRNYAQEADPPVRVVVVDRAGNTLLDTNPLNEDDGLRNFSGREEFRIVLDEGDVARGRRYSQTLGNDLVYVAVPVADQGEVVGGLRLTYLTDPIDSATRRYWLFLGTMALVSILAVALLGVLLARWLARPIDRLEAAAVALGAGKLGSRVEDPKGPEELKALAKAFNRTAARLQELVASQDAFVADASHQLRTPLTGLRLRLENLEPDVADVAREDLDAAIAEVDRMARMVDGLLTLARADRGERGPLAPVDIRPIVEERVLTWIPLAEERSIELTNAVVGATWVMGDADRLTQVIDNLIANALDALNDGMVTVWAAPRETEPSTVDVHVTDNGPGMTPHERSRAFDRFWRADPRRRGDFGGSGLGLAIVAKLVRADSGEVRLDETPGGGLDAVVTLLAVELLPPPAGERRRRALYR
jgi:signal transduction histidine kinase